jgi:hypothetical protein
MNLDDLQNDWNSPRNNLRSGQQRKVAERFTQQMIRRRRFQLLWLINTFVLLSAATFVAFRAVAAHKVNFEREWVMLPLLVLPWAFAFHFLRRYLNPPGSLAKGETSVADSLRAALDSNRAEQSNLRRVALLFAVMVPLLGVAVQQLQSAGKISPGNELTSMVVFFAVALLLGGTGIAVRYFARLRPQQRHLDALLADLAD